jgi:glycosyltransferase involved in cell wall biosynthesis
VGNISKAKGIDVLLKANRLLDPKKQIHFILIGAGNVEKIIEDDKHNISEYHLDRIHMLGYQTNKALADLYNVAKVKIMPSRSEGFSISCLEAMASGLPVIASAGANMDDAIVGDVYEANNPNNLAKSIEKIHSLSKDQHQTLSDKAIKKASEYSWENIAETRLKYYNEIIATKDHAK